MRQSMEVLISHVFPTSKWTSDPEVDAGCCSHLKIWTLFQRARVSGLHLLLRSLAFTCLSSRSTLRSLWKVYFLSFVFLLAAFGCPVCAAVSLYAHFSLSLRELASGQHTYADPTSH